jgi:hypothetical protein
MKVTIKAGDQILGTEDWDHLPALKTIILCPSTGGPKQPRRVDKIEDNPSGGKVVYVGGAQPTFSYPQGD